MSPERFPRLFEPGKIGGLQLKNRIMMPAMGARFCTIWGEATDTLVDWYRRRAAGGCGLVTVEATMSATAIDGIRITPLVLRADDACYIGGLSRIAEAVHEKGAKIGIQLSAGAGAQAEGGPYTPGFQVMRDVVPVSPSGVPGIGYKTQPRVLTEDEIERMVELCANAAKNVMQAGFDLIEIHAHSGHLIGQFMSPYFNKRTDKYGGSFENRCRFLLNIAHAMRKMVGGAFPITVKYSIEDHLPGGWDLQQSKDLAVKLEAAGLDAIAISSGARGAKVPAVPPYFHPKGTFIHYAEVIKSVVKIPIIVSGRLDDPKLAEKVLAEGKADFISEGRALISDPDWPRKVSSGELEGIRPCLACNQCRHLGHKGRPIRCSVNAVVGREGQIGEIRPAAVKKKVLVVGAGPSGLEAARVAAMRGHMVTLCERYRHPGGLMLLGGVHNEQISALADWLVSQVKSLPVDLRLNTEVTPDIVERMAPNAVILAIGGSFVHLDIPGINGNNVFSAHDLLMLMNGVGLKKGALIQRSPAHLKLSRA